jgi:mannosyltransferase
MDLLRRAGKFIPRGSPPQLPLSDEKGKPRSRRTLASHLAYLRKPLRLRGNSTISVPLGVVVLFPCIVVILILVLFVRHPNSPGRILMPAGAPPAIRLVASSDQFPPTARHFC